MQRLQLSRWILVLGLAFVFAYFGIVKFTEPLAWIGWIPSWMDGLLGLSKNVWLQIIGTTEIVIAAALIFTFVIVQRFAALVAVGHLIGILTQVGWNDVGVRDIGLMMMAAGLFFMPAKITK